MKTLLLEEILTAIGIKPSKVQEGIFIVNVIHDTYNAKKDTLFFFIYKEQILDGEKLKMYNHFYIVTDIPFLNMEKVKPEQIIMVDDVKAALFKFTSYYRHMFTIPVVAITGTCGKTTTKDMLKHILQTDFTVQATIENKNSSFFHLPYLVGVDEETDIAVIEIGVGQGHGMMEEACKYFFPTIGIFTMIDIDHIDEFPSFNDYIAEKEKLIDGLNNKGTLIINIDDPHILSMGFTKYKGNIVTYGKSNHAAIQIKESRFHKNGMEFFINYQMKEYEGFIPGVGEHNVYNAVAAIAAAVDIGVDIKVAIKRLTSFQHLRSHFEIIELQNRITIIDDTWKSNRASLETGLRLLADISSPSQRKIAVLGRMGPLGQYSDETYKRLGKLLVDIGTDKLITKGYFGKEIAKAAFIAGMSRKDVTHFSDKQEIQEFLDTLLQSNDIVFFKIWDSDESFRDIIQHLKNK